MGSLPREMEPKLNKPTATGGKGGRGTRAVQGNLVARTERGLPLNKKGKPIGRFWEGGPQTQGGDKKIANSYRKRGDLFPKQKIHGGRSPQKTKGFAPPKA